MQSYKSILAVYTKEKKIPILDGFLIWLQWWYLDMIFSDYYFVDSGSILFLKYVMTNFNIINYLIYTGLIHKGSLGYFYACFFFKLFMWQNMKIKQCLPIIINNSSLDNNR